MAKTLRVFGASDDLLEVRGMVEDEFDGKGVLHLESNGILIVVHPIYAGSWGFAVTTEVGDDCDLMPDWPIRCSFGEDVQFSETLEIDVPDDTRLTYVANGGEFLGN